SKTKSPLQSQEELNAVYLEDNVFRTAEGKFYDKIFDVIKIIAVLYDDDEEEDQKNPRCIITDIGSDTINPLVRSLFLLLHYALWENTRVHCDICEIIYPFLSKMLVLGLSEQFEDSLVEDILETCRSIAFAKDNSIKDSLLSILLPHILPWMKKYPDKKFFLHWTHIMKNISVFIN
ncbi:hypothetical protein ADUPG1_006658, partial [Aduncisulcus paluster]